MGFNSKYTGAQIEELLSKIPTTNTIWHTGNLSKLSQLENDLNFVTGSTLGNYLPLSGGTLSGQVTTVSGHYHADGNFAINLNNSDIVGTNGIYFADTANVNSEGLCFVRSNGNWDTLRAEDGVLKFATNNSLTSLTTSATYNTVWHSGNDGSGSGLDADTLDGYQPSSLNVGSAAKLQTARTIWGQSFDGTGNVDGFLYLLNNKSIYSYNSDKSASYEVLRMNSANTLVLGNGSSAVGGDLILDGNSIYLRCGTTHANTIFVNSSGDVGIGTTSPQYKLDVNGAIHSSSSITQDSDINLKDISKDVLLSLDDISGAPLFEFTYKNDENKRIHVGTSAQYWVEKNNWFCKKQDNGYYDMEIQNLALASAISIAKEFKRYKEVTESTIISMKEEIEELKKLISNINK